MNATSVKLYNFDLSDSRTYLFAALFVIGNLALPQLCHLVPNGGHILLPIYFFTLVASYKYGLAAGLMTAILSPVLNHALFGMPAAAVLPAILTKSVLLAIAASFLAKRYGKVSLALVAATVLFYQLAGSLAELAFFGGIDAALTDLRYGIPGMLLQVFGGWAILKYVLTK